MYFFCRFKSCLSRMAGALVLFFFLGGCANHLPYETLSGYIRAGECPAALDLVEKDSDIYGGNSELLYLLDSAMVHMQCRDFNRAQEKFRAAEDLSRSLWTLSLSRETASLLANDYLLEYGGEDYEQAMIHLMSAIAFLDAGEPEEALVECRRLDSLLGVFNERYEGKSIYKEDAFGRYLSGILHEAAQDLDAAYIDYQKAVKAYADYERYYHTPAPDSLKRDLIRVADRVGRLDDARFLVPGFEPGGGSKKNISSLGQVLVIQLSGRAPVKKQGRIIIPGSQGPVTIAFPRLERVSHPAGQKVLLLTPSSGGEPVEISLDLAADINAIAQKNLEDRRLRIAAKAIARAVAKQAIIRQAAKNEDKALEEAVEQTLNLLNILLEQADTRSWRTLPAGIHMARQFIQPGSYGFNDKVLGSEVTKKILVKPGKINYIVIYDALGYGNN